MSSQSTSESTSSAAGKAPIAIAMVGNPGTGKSTILNGLVQEVVFKSGVNIGSGMTTILEQSRKDNVIYYDTPGLADAAIKKEAGQELDKLLREDQALKLVFVVTLEAGRVRPQDTMTINLVLDAIRFNVNNRFGVIVNKLSKSVLKALEEKPEKEALMRRQLTEKYSTSHWCYVEKCGEIDDADNQMLTQGNIFSFLFSLPETKPKGTETTSIDTHNVVEEFEEKLSAMEKANEEVRAGYLEEPQKQKLEARERERGLLEAIRAAQRNEEARLAEEQTNRAAETDIAILDKIAALESALEKKSSDTAWDFSSMAELARVLAPLAPPLIDAVSDAIKDNMRGGDARMSAAQADWEEFKRTRGPAQ